MTSSPFHQGELSAQKRLGLDQSIGGLARQFIRPFMPDQHREFFEQLPFMVAAARDQNGKPWATMLAGEPGFVTAIDSTQLAFAARPAPGDPLSASFATGTQIGLLGIELHTRRRNRVNGVITELSQGGFTFKTTQSFGNCPQYITERSWIRADSTAAPPQAQRFNKLNGQQRSWIENADTFFIASGYNKDQPHSEANGMDASHRGGNPGFVEVLNDTTLVFPDYSGNNFFNTIGNLLIDPRAGLLFVDFAQGHLLQISGTARIDWDSPKVAKRPGAQRLIYLEIDEVVLQENVLPIRWESAQNSLYKLRVEKRVRESDNITSFLLINQDGKPLPSFQPGQHLPIEIPVDGEEPPVKRTYSLSNEPNQAAYRISIKREPNGFASKILHDQINKGDVLNAWQPAGDFVLNDSDRPVALISAGVGITPMLSMLKHLVGQQSERRILFIHGARNGEQHAFSEEVRAIEQTNDNVETVFAYSQPCPTDVKGRDFDATGHVSGTLVRDLIPELDAEFYLCGPSAFLSDMTTALSEVGVDENRIFFETFGPASVQPNQTNEGNDPA